MCLLIETVKIRFGCAENIIWHNKRFNSARLDLFGIHEEADLANFILVPEKFSGGVVKCRIGYSEEIEFIEFEPYIFHPVRSLQVVFDDHILYNYKYRDRSRINELFANRGVKDDILIVKNGLVRESSYCNLVFSDGKKLFTPTEPLLKGTKRAKYLAEGKITERDIKVEDIASYHEIHLINAFLDLGMCVVLTGDL